MDVGAKRRGQNARAHRERGHRLVVAPPVAPQIGAAVKRVPKVDLGARLQSAVAHGHRGEPRVREPVVDRAHPAAFPAAVELAEPRNGSDITLVGTDDGNALLVRKARNRRHRAVRGIQVDIPLGDDAAGRRVVYASGPRNGVADADVHLPDRRFPSWNIAYRSKRHAGHKRAGDERRQQQGDKLLLQVHAVLPFSWASLSNGLRDSPFDTLPALRENAASPAVWRASGRRHNARNAT